MGLFSDVPTNTLHGDIPATSAPATLPRFTGPAVDSHDCLRFVVPIDSHTDEFGNAWAHYDCSRCGEGFTVFLGTDVNHVRSAKPSESTAEGVSVPWER